MPIWRPGAHLEADDGQPRVGWPRLRDGCHGTLEAGATIS